MSKKNLRKYNKETQKWEIVSAPDISIEAKLPDGSEITDNNVRITNENYESGSTLNDALEAISEGMNRLERNVSWLDSHKGEGGGGGGGGTSYKIVVTSPAIDNGRVFVKQDTLNIEFMITGPSIEEECVYSYIFNGVESTNTTIYTNTPVVIRNIVLPESSDFSTFTIKAKSPYGINIAPVTFNIYKTSVDLKFNKEAAGDKYDNGVFKVKTGQQSAIIPLILINGIQNAYVTITVSANTGEQYSMAGNENAGTIDKDFDFWALINKSEAQVGTYYLLKFWATATLDTHVATSDEFYLRVTIIDSDSLSITAGINGYDAGSEAVVIQPENLMRYNFRTYAPKTVRNVYYAAKLENKTTEEEFLILGEYFDETLHNSGATAYTANSMVSVGETKTSQYYIANSVFSEGNVASLYIKIWDENGTSVSLEQKILIGEVDNTIFPKQIPSRLAGTNSKDTLFLSWNKSNASETSKFQWVSYINNYIYLSSEMARIHGTVATANINIFDGNVSSGIISHSGLPYLRCQNHAYGVCDLSAYGGNSGEIVALTDNRSENTFTISITLQADSSTNEGDTIFLWGTNNASGELSSGIKITAGMIYWVIDTDRLTKERLSCRMTPGKKKTIDFSFERTSYGSVAKIYVDGIVNCATNFNNFGEDYSLPNFFYLGADLVNSDVINFCSCNIYDISVFSKILNDVQITSNAKNAQIDASVEEEREEYKEWKDKNFITANALDESISESLFLKGGSYTSGFSYNETNNIAQKSNIPTLILTFDSNGNFNKSDFFTKKEKSDTGLTYNGFAEYYDPEASVTVRFYVWVSYQGTTTLTYRVKNLELGVADEVTIDGITVPKLFQPKKTWFPEKQFTLKADVVDSAHANNAVLGEWINNCNMLSPNPAMTAFNAGTRPKDVDDNGNRVWHDYHGESIDYNEDVTIKHTLEGFPILLFIKFSDSSDYTFIGIYSFNLGRFSYFNMGLQFLESFSRRDQNGDIACPKIINYYKTTPTLGTSADAIKSSECYSFEFGDEGNHSVREHPVWSQYDPSVIKTYGEFRYPTDVSPEMPIWTKLCELFELAAKTPAENYYGEPITVFKVKNGDIYENLHKYIVNSSGMYEDTHQIIDVNDAFAEQLADRLNINNAVVYFIIANAFGMTDSLGKNMVLRTWDNGQTWWICFYDMDTALGLSNKGMEDVPITVSIDEITMENVGQETKLKTTYHSVNSRFAAASSKLWGLLRDTSVLYKINSQHYFYETIWNTLRKNGGQLSYAENFIRLMESRVKTCGEIVYNCDYYQKYIILDSAGLDSAIGFLHGTRIDFVRDWLKKHFSFLDGVFDVDFATGEYNFSDTDSTFNNSNNTAVINFRQIGGEVIPFTLRVNTPSFVAFNVDQDPFWNKFYISESGVDTLVYIRNSTSASSLIQIKGAVSLTKLDGLRGNFMGFGNNSGAPFRSLVVFDVVGSQDLQQGAPFRSTYFIYDGNSPLESINFSNTGNRTTQLTDYSLDLGALSNLLSVNVSDSEVTSIVLPSSSLRSLNFRNSNLTAIRIAEQNRIDTFDFTGCNKMERIEIYNCSAIRSLEFINLNVLTSLSIEKCDSLTSVTIENCSYLSSITINNNNALEILSINEILNSNSVKISVNGGHLTRASITRTNCTAITLPDTSKLGDLESLNLSYNFGLSSIRYGNNEPITYDGYPVFDFSMLPSLVTFSLKNVSNVKYIRVSNIEESPFVFNGDTIEGCSGVIRVFGHLKIGTPGTFSGLKNFFINDWGIRSYSSSITDTEWNNIWNNEMFEFREGDDVTNLTIDSTEPNISLSSCFTDTKCNEIDAIYVFKKISGRVINIDNMFRKCTNIVTSFKRSLPSQIFENCTGVKTATRTFLDCISITTRLTSTMLAPIMSENGLTSFNEMFSECRVLVDCEHPLFPEGNVIEFISGFSPTYYVESEYQEYETGEILPSLVLSNLSKLERIDNSFDSIYFYPTNDFKLLYKCTALKEINLSFNNFKCFDYDDPSDDGIIKNILGKDTEDYPQLTIIQESFNGFGDTQTQRIAIGNSFFGHSRSSLISVQSSFFRLVKTIDFTDCDGYNFPYKIFDGCVKLEIVDNLFNGMNCALSGGVENTGVTLPSYTDESGNTVSMFKDCEKLKAIPGLFSNLTNIRYTLNNYGFKNCRLENVSNLFANSDYRALKGGIPFNFFYEEDENGCPVATITDISYVFRDCKSLDCKYYEFDGTGEELFEKYYDGSGEVAYKWNTSVFDGTRTFSQMTFSGKTIQELGIEKGLYELPPEFTVGYITANTFNSSINGNDIGVKENGSYYNQADYLNIFSKENYFCPPDIFKFCVNSQETNIEGAFSGTTNSDGGLFGKIPPTLLRPVSNVTSINALFDSCSLLLPDSWGRERLVEETTVVIDYGKYYPSNFFAGMNSLMLISSTFRKNKIWGKTVIDLSVLPNTITNMSATFTRAIWIGEAKFEGNLSALTKLTDISDMLSYNGPTGLPNNFITVLYNPDVYYCAGFMRNNARTETGIPEIWQYPFVYVSQYQGAFAGTAQSVKDLVAENVSSTMYQWMVGS